MIVELWHGRDNASDETDGWGFVGPTFNHLSKVEVAQDQKTIILYSDSADDGVERAIAEITLEEDCYAYGGKFYGDMSIATSTGYHSENKNGIVLQQHDKNILCSWMQLTYSFLSRVGSETVEEMTPEDVNDRHPFVVIPLEKHDGETTPLQYSLEDYKRILECSCHNLYRLKVDDLFADDADIETYRAAAIAPDDAAEDKGGKYDLIDVRAAIIPTEMKKNLAALNRERMKE